MLCPQVNASVSAVMVGLLCGVVGMGCSGEEPTYQVRGRVVFADDQQPLPGGVTIVLESTRPPHDRSSADVQPDGTFVMSSRRQGDGSIEGEHRVRFTAPVSQGAPDATENVSRIIDRRYAEFATSELTVEIKPSDDNELVISVERATEGKQASEPPAAQPALPPSRDPEAIRSPDLDAQ